MHVLICSPHAIVRSGIASTLKARYRDSDVSVTMACTQEEFETAVPRHSPTVVVWHLNDDQSVLPVAARSSPLEVVAVAEDQKLDGATILSVFRQGACAIVSLTDDLRGLPEACYRASIRRSYLSGSLLDPLLSHLSRPSFNRTAREFGLTPREYEVLTHLAHGQTHREIAATLRTTERTVRHHLEQIYRKLRVQNRLQAVIHAYRQGLAF